MLPRPGSRRRVLRAGGHGGLLALFMTAFLVTSGGAQVPAVVSLSGRVIDATSGDPVQNAVVAVPARSRAVLSGEAGEFALGGLPPGTHVLRVRQFGYADLIVTVTAPSPEVTLLLEPEAVEIPGLDVDVDGAASLSGRVLDGASGLPMPGVHVWLALAEEGTHSDSSGAFTFPATPLGPQLIQVQRAGYGSQIVPVSVVPSTPPVDVMLYPDSAVLRGLPEVSRELRRRRNAALTNVFVLEGERLAALPVSNAREAIQNYTLAFIVPCVGAARSHWCVDYRGSPVEPRVCIDGELAWGGIDELSDLRPHELHMVEVYGTSALVIRAYTHAYMEEMARGPTLLLGEEPGGSDGLGWRSGRITTPDANLAWDGSRC